MTTRDLFVSLPRELRMEILGYCFRHGQKISMFEKSDIDPRLHYPTNASQDSKSVDIAILATCKELRTCGVRMFWSDNTFHLHSISALDKFVSTATEETLQAIRHLELLHRCPSGSDSITSLRYSLCHQDRWPPPSLTSLSALPNLTCVHIGTAWLPWTDGVEKLVAHRFARRDWETATVDGATVLDILYGTESRSDPKHVRQSLSTWHDHISRGQWARDVMLKTIPESTLDKLSLLTSDWCYFRPDKCERIEQEIDLLDYARDVRGEQWERSPVIQAFDATDSEIWSTQHLWREARAARNWDRFADAANEDLLGRSAFWCSWTWDWDPKYGKGGIPRSFEELFEVKDGEVELPAGAWVVTKGSLRR